MNRKAVIGTTAAVIVLSAAFGAGGGHDESPAPEPPAATATQVAVPEAVAVPRALQENIATTIGREHRGATPAGAFAAQDAETGTYYIALAYRMPNGELGHGIWARATLDSDPSMIYAVSPNAKEATPTLPEADDESALQVFSDSAYAAQEAAEDALAAEFGN